MIISPLVSLFLNSYFLFAWRCIKAFKLSVVITKEKRRKWELNVKTSKLTEARENACDKSQSVLASNLTGWKSGASFLDQSRTERGELVIIITLADILFWSSLKFRQSSGELGLDKLGVCKIQDSENFRTYPSHIIY